MTTRTAQQIDQQIQEAIIERDRLIQLLRENEDAQYRLLYDYNVRQIGIRYRCRLLLGLEDEEEDEDEEEEEEEEKEEEEEEEDTFDYKNSCDCCVKGWDYKNEFGWCNCWCSKCDFLLRDCRYNCKYYKNIK